ncbi:MAG: hypothetical protein LBI02_01480 [Opitutaceae bacterium]|nr:hypothetical protein [Opitutaceae bacterium]
MTAAVCNGCSAHSNATANAAQLDAASSRLPPPAPSPIQTTECRPPPCAPPSDAPPALENPSRETPPIFSQKTNAALRAPPKRRRAGMPAPRTGSPAPLRAPLATDPPPHSEPHRDHTRRATPNKTNAAAAWRNRLPK